MTNAEVAAMVAEIGLPYAYYQFPDNTEQAPPFVCFFYTDNSDFLADDTNYQEIRKLAVELYTENKEFTLEETVKSILKSHGLVYSVGEDFIESERMHITVFYMSVVITEV